MAKRSSGKKVTFEKAMDQLAQIVEQIEAGQIGLEESLEKYAQGVKLIAHCRQVLTEAEKKIQQLSADTETGLKAKPLEEAEGD